MERPFTKKVINSDRFVTQENHWTPPVRGRPRNDLLLRAFARETVPRAPVWMMRQAGRADPEYLAYRERVGLPLYDLFRSPEHAVPITLLPKRFGVGKSVV